jgi:hypothetical protein
MVHHRFDISAAGADIVQASHSGQDASVINRHAPVFSQYRDLLRIPD